MDCEMVAVGGNRNISILARVSIVSFDGTTILDGFCKTKERVTDYRTHVSGVRPGDLSGENAIEYGQLRSRVQCILRNKILVGHGLQNDLKVLNYQHPPQNIRDTACYPPLMRFGLQPQKLRNLAWSELGQVVQQGEHSSVEDALASLGVYKKHQAGWELGVYRGMRGSYLNSSYNHSMS